MPLYVPTPVADISDAVWAHLPARKLTALNDPTDLIKYIAKGTGSEIPANTSLYDVLNTLAPGVDVTTLLSRLTAARALLLDEITVARMSELDAVNIPADIDTLLVRLTAARALLLDHLDADISTRATPAQIATLLANLDVAVSTRATPAQVWAVAARDLTKKVGSETSFVLPHAAPQVFNDVLANDLTTLSATVTIPSGATLTRCPLAVIIDAVNQAATAEDIDIDVFFRKQGGAWGAAIYSENDVLALPGVDRAPNSLVALADVFAIVNAGGVGVYEMKVTIQMNDAHNVQFVYQGLLAFEVEGA